MSHSFDQYTSNTLVMPSSTVWKRREDDTTVRNPSPTRPRAASIERLSPEPVPTTPQRSSSHSRSSASRKKKDTQTAGQILQGLGLSHTPLNETSKLDPDPLYFDSTGRAHLSAKHRSPKQDESSKSNPRRTNPRAASSQYRGPPKRSHVRTGSTIDDLASIAIATSPQFISSSSFTFAGSPPYNSISRPSTSYVNGHAQETFDRPAKRIKSERIPQSEWTARDQIDRPRSSYTVPPEVKKEDAELLLSLSHDFRFTPTKTTPSRAQQPQDNYLQIPQQPDYRRDVHRVEDIVMQEVSAGPSNILQPPLPQHGDEPEPATEIDPDETLPEDESTDEDHKPLETATQQSKPPPIQAATGTVEKEIDTTPPIAAPTKPRRVTVQTQPVCPACKKMQYNGREGELTINWINCEGSCNGWFHIPCAGLTDQEVKKVAKFICPACAPKHGKTVYARTSTRARAAPDYAALNEGVMKTAEDSSIHHFVSKLKDGTIQYQQDDFARIRPEILTKDFWANMNGSKRPFVVPACWNPRFGESDEHEMDTTDSAQPVTAVSSTGEVVQLSVEASQGLRFDQQQVVDVDQDYLEMVMPRNLTVRKVAELYGPDEPVPVIEVKTQETRGKFTLRQWANYYEEAGSKPIRNVISLEVSHSRLGRLIRRPKVVRDIDLEPQVWDPTNRAASKSRPIAFYCLMSVGDSYTDFHIDFGGSSVYYHILQGQKTFFFIPPEDRYLKKYEEWNNSPHQNDTWLPDLCGGNVTRVDLFPGDTAFIPAGWIHSVWTPCDSLVIGGNFLTRYDLDAQIKVTQIEKATHVAPSFRYPFFQKVMWYTMLKYLEEDPPPESVIHEFHDDPEHRYLRAIPIWQEADVKQYDDEPDDGEYNQRKYTQSELRGLHSLRDYIYRTARIYSDLLVENINKKQIDAVKASVPKGHGDPLQLVCLFAIWVAWKRGNEVVPDWVHIEPLPQDFDRRDKDKIKKDTFRLPPERVSARRKNAASPAPLSSDRQDTPETRESSILGDTPKLPYPNIACQNCRKKRQKCHHQYSYSSKVEETAQQTLEKSRRFSNVSIDIVKLAKASPVVATETSSTSSNNSTSLPPPNIPVAASTGSESGEESNSDTSPAPVTTRDNSQPPEGNGITMNGIHTTPNSSHKKATRSKACEECRKSKRRCVHDEHGRVDPAKAAEPSKPRGSQSGKRPRMSDDHQSKRIKSEPSIDNEYAMYAAQPEFDAMIDPAIMGPQDGMTSVYPDPILITDVQAISTPPHPLSTENGVVQNLPYNIDPNLDPALMDPPAYEPLPELVSAPIPTSLPLLRTAAIGTPDLDNSYSPITTGSGDTGIKNEHQDESELRSKVVASIETTVKPRRPSTATATSPHENGTSPTSRRSSSRTSSATYRNTVVINSEPDQSAEKMSPNTRQVLQAHVSSEDPEAIDEDPSEKLARDLQAQEHGLRRRPSVRIS